MTRRGSRTAQLGGGLSCTVHRRNSMTGSNLQGALLPYNSTHTYVPAGGFCHRVDYTAVDRSSPCSSTLMYAQTLHHPRDTLCRFLDLRLGEQGTEAEPHFGMQHLLRHL